MQRSCDDVDGVDDDDVGGDGDGGDNVDDVDDDVQSPPGVSLVDHSETCKGHFSGGGDGTLACTIDSIGRKYEC